MGNYFTFTRSFLYSQFLVSLPEPSTDYSGQTIIVTGANIGLGYEAAKYFVRLHASKVIIACRNLEKGQAAKSRIEHDLQHGNKDTIEVWHLDLSSFQSVKDFAAKASGLQRLDVLLENAGITSSKFVVTEGSESTLTTNVFSTELLALLILPKLRETATKFNVTPRLSIVTSDLHFLTDFPERHEADIFSALNDPSTSSMPERYQVTKLIEILFVRALASRLDASSPLDKRSESRRPQVIINCMTPGACHSDFFRDLGFWAGLSMAFMKFIVARTTEQGARTLLAAAGAGVESHGQYMADCHVARPSEFVTSEEGRDLQERLWQQTLKKFEEIQPGISRNI